MKHRIVKKELVKLDKISMMDILGGKKYYMIVEGRVIVIDK